MDAAVIRERTQAVPNGRVGELPPDADPTMTRAAREKRAAWRLEHLDAWFRGLEELDHHDPEYDYDVAHEYEDDWTTDPDYGVAGVDLCEFDEDGVIILPDPRAGRIQYRMCDTACDALGNRVEIETHVHYRPPGAGRGGRRRVKRVRPDLMVLPSALELPPEEDLDPDDKPDRALRLHEGDPPPELVLEILSEGGAQRDLDEKLRLYTDLGVVEYLVYDLGGKRTPGSKVELLVFRLTDGAYRRLDPDPAMSASNGDVDAYWSNVFGTHIRMQPDRWRPRFQWYDPVQGRWRDRETDEQHRIRAQGREEGREEERGAAAISVMREFLESKLAPAHLDRIEAVWRRDGPPTDAFRRIRAVQRTPDAWGSLLRIPDDDIGSERRQ
ncbi:MAG: Uma2 family endonuclease [Caldilineaceae bacterium]|nr:Uma2 family endonuclease [Caldilineaceae bacterium]